MQVYIPATLSTGFVCRYVQRTVPRAGLPISLININKSDAMPLRLHAYEATSH